MGSVGSKSHLERRNTVVRRTQRKSIHGIKAKVVALTKEIKRFSGTTEDGTYQDLINRLDRLKFELIRKEKELQPQVVQIYNETFTKIKNCRQLLEDKLARNQQGTTFEEDDTESVVPSVLSENTTVRDEELEEALNLEQSTNKRRTVELKVVQIQSPESKRASVAKFGVPVMPMAMIQAQQEQPKAEEQLAFIRTNIQHLEMEISEFVGRKDGKHYNRIRDKLLFYKKQLLEVKEEDEEIGEQIKLCVKYIGNCLSFLDEKAVVEREDSDDEVFTPKSPEVQFHRKVTQAVVEPVLTHPNIKTTYI